MTEFDRALQRYDAENQNRPLPRVWFFAVGNDGIMRSTRRPKPILWDGAWKSYKLAEINECDQVAVYK